MNFDNFQFRCHNIGKIIPAKPNGKLSVGAKTFLDKLYTDTVLNRPDELYSMYLDKGIQCEEESIDLYSNLYGFCVKNDDLFENEYLRGTPDIVLDKIVDVKSSWDSSTYPLTRKEVKNKEYKYQLTAYMVLTNKKESELAYCLVDTPPRLIRSDLRRLDRKFDIYYDNGEYNIKQLKLVVELVKRHTFTMTGLEAACEELDLPIDLFENFTEVEENLRCNVLPFEYNPELYQNIIDHILLAREYLNSIS